MSSTNHTTNYNLPQFIGTDKPAWLGDVNPALAAIDAQMKLNADAAAAASSAASIADGKAVSAGQAASTADGKAETAQTTANGAVSGVNALQSKLTLSDNTSMNVSEFSFAIANDGGTFNLSQSADGSLFKFYGEFLFANTNNNTRTIALVQIPKGDSDTQYYGIKTALQLNTAPAGSYVISCGLMRTTTASGAISGIWGTSFAIGADGYVYLNPNPSSSGTFQVPASGSIRLTGYPCVYFNSNFGDLPE